MGKVSRSRFRRDGRRLRARAMQLMKQLDAEAGYRELIERELMAAQPRCAGPARDERQPAAPVPPRRRARAARRTIRMPRSASGAERSSVSSPSPEPLIGSRRSAGAPPGHCVGAIPRAAQMPDPQQMSASASSRRLPAGTVTVRVIRGSLDQSRHQSDRRDHRRRTAPTAITNDSGRAEFKGLPAGARLRASRRPAASGWNRRSSRFRRTVASGCCSWRRIVSPPASDVRSRAGQRRSGPARDAGGARRRIALRVRAGRGWPDGLLYPANPECRAGARSAPEAGGVRIAPDAARRDDPRGLVETGDGQGREVKVAGPFAPGDAGAGRVLAPVR